MTAIDTDTATEHRLLSTADRVTQHEAKRHFEAGGTVLVSERGHELTYPIYFDTTFHTRETTSWDRLLELVQEFRGRYPNQRFYVVRPVDANAVSVELAQILRELSLSLFNDLLDENVVTQEHSQQAGIARKLSVLLTSAVALRSTELATTA
jgi:hypothetical protein